jgi:uncharacterized membrane protein YdjX (TVP38/TMEM64 family)
MRLTIDRLRPALPRAVALVLLVLVLVVLMRSDELYAALLNVFTAASTIIAARPLAGALLFMLLAALSAMLGFFSSTVLIPAAVLVWGTPGTIALLWAGWLLGGMVAHSIARYVGRPMLRWLVSPTVLTRYAWLLDSEPRFSTVLLLQAAMPSELVGYLLGLARYPLLHYTAALGIIEVPWAIGTVLLGVGFMERDTASLVGITILGVLSLAVIARLSRRLRHGGTARIL